MLVALATVNASTPLTGSFKDEFSDAVVFADNWRTPVGTVSGVGTGYVTLTANASLTSQPVFHHGVLTMNVSLTNSSMTDAIWGWSGLPFGGEMTNVGAFFYYNGTTDKMYAILGSLNATSGQISQLIPEFDKTQYFECSITWTYTGVYDVPRFIFGVNSQQYVADAIGQLQGLDFFSFPVFLAVNGTSSAAKLNADYVVVSDTIVTVQTTTSTTTKTQTSTTTSTTTSNTVTTMTSTSTSTSTASATTTSTITTTSTTTIPATTTSTSTLLSYSTTTSGTYRTNTTTSVSTLTVASTTTTLPTTTTLTTISGTATSITTSVSTTYSTNYLQTTAYSTTTVSATAQEWGYIYAIIGFIGVAILCGYVVLHKLLGRAGKAPPERYTGGGIGGGIEPIVEKG